MSGLYEFFAPLISGYSKDECTKVLSAVQQQIELNEDDVQHAASRIDNALTDPNRQMWNLFVSNRKQYIADLDQLKDLLVEKLGR